MYAGVILTMVMMSCAGIISSLTLRTLAGNAASTRGTHACHKMYRKVNFIAAQLRGVVGTISSMFQCLRVCGADRQSGLCACEN